jgi:hypothetical protein
MQIFITLSVDAVSASRDGHRSRDRVPVRERSRPGLVVAQLDLSGRSPSRVIDRFARLSAADRNRERTSNYPCRAPIGVVQDHNVWLSNPNPTVIGNEHQPRGTPISGAYNRTRMVCC